MQSADTQQISFLYYLQPITHLAQVRLAGRQRSPNGQRGTIAVHYTPRRSLRDGNSVAGDLLVNRIVQNVLLAVGLRASRSTGSRTALRRVALVDSKATTKLVRIVRLVFIPLVNQWLQPLTTSGAYPDSQRRPIVVRPNLAHADCLAELNGLVLCMIVASWSGLS